jgi:hypothetical protein
MIYNYSHNIDLDLVFIDFFFILKRRCNHWIDFYFIFWVENIWVRVLNKF